MVFWVRCVYTAEQYKWARPFVKKVDHSVSCSLFVSHVSPAYVYVVGASELIHELLQYYSDGASKGRM